MAPRFKTALACELSKVDRMQFNEAVANGFYTCAPETTKGSTRIFDLDQTVALFIFGHLLKLGLSSRDAGGITCSLYETFSQTQSSKFDAVARLVGITGAPVTTMVNSREALPEKFHSIGDVVRSLVFNVKKIRDHLIRMADDAQSNAALGSDD